MTAADSPAVSSNPMANVTLYWRVSGVALALVAVLGIALSAAADGDFVAGFLEFDWTHNVVHVLLAALALTFGFANIPGHVSKMVAKIVGIVYLLLGVLGFIPPVAELLDDLLGLHLEVGENLIHLLIGLWGAVAGFGNE